MMPTIFGFFGGAALCGVAAATTLLPWARESMAGWAAWTIAGLTGLSLFTLSWSGAGFLFLAAALLVLGLSLICAISATSSRTPHILTILSAQLAGILWTGAVLCDAMHPCFMGACC